MTSIFSQLPNDLIMKIIKMNTDKEIEENRSKYNIIVKRLKSHFRLCCQPDIDDPLIWHYIFQRVNEDRYGHYTIQ